MATVDISGNRLDANVVLLPEVEVGDYVMVHAGFAISKYEPEDAQETLRLFEEIDRVMAEQEAAAGGAGT